MKKILIVEDTLTERLFLEKLLQKNNFDTVSVENGVKALEKLYSDKFDLILSDLIMPAMDGMELLQICQEKFSFLPFIMITAFAEENQNAIRALKMGAEDCVFKEFKNQELIARINKALMNFETKMNLKKSRQQFKALVDNLNDAVFSIDTDGNILYLSKQWEQILGDNIAEWIGKPFFEIVHSQSKSEIKKLIKKMFQTRENINNFELLAKHKTGKVIHFVINAAVLQTNKENSLKIIGVARDVTEKKIFENKIEKYSKDLEELVKQKTEKLEALKEKIELFKSAFYYTKIPSFLSDKTLKIISANMSLLNLLKFDEKEIIGRKISDFTSQKVIDEQLLKDLQKYDKWEGKIIFSDKNNTTVPAILTIYIIKDNKNKIIEYLGNIEKID